MQVLREQWETQVLQETQVRRAVAVLVKPMYPFVLKLAYPVDSEVDGSEQGTAERISERQVQHGSPFSPFWHSLLPLIPC